jgi:peptide/nickel transport system substrate-binding protein
LPRAPRLTQTLAAALLTSGLAAGLTLSGCRPKHEASANRLVVASKNRIDTVDPGGAYTFGAMQRASYACVFNPATGAAERAEITLK